jgi:ubiquinone/menaquinone biosynthesis C-methylase UbiE
MSNVFVICHEGLIGKRVRMDNVERVRADFDRLAVFSGDEWSHNSHYHAYLLRHLPSRCADVLEIGCGTGHFTRQLAQRSRKVVALDLSPNMIRIAGERAEQYSNIEFVVADVMTWDMPPDQFDCIASIATFHHLPLDIMLGKAKQALRPGGTLLVLDLYQAAGLRDVLQNLIAAPVSYYLKYRKNGSVASDPAAQGAWQEHGQYDVYPTLSEVRGVCTKLLPGARVTQHLLWRYSIVWRKPS